jgi:hypothetical protein
MRKEAPQLIEKERSKNLLGKTNDFAQTAFHAEKD